MSEVRRVRKRPIEVEAIRWTGDNTMDVIDWIIATGILSARWHEEVPAVEPDADGKSRDADPEHIAINTLEGTMRADLGDWVIRGIQNEHYPCKPDIFQATYEVLS